MNQSGKILAVKMKHNNIHFNPFSHFSLCRSGLGIIHPRFFLPLRQNCSIFSVAGNFCLARELGQLTRGSTDNDGNGFRHYPFTLGFGFLCLHGRLMIDSICLSVRGGYTRALANVLSRVQADKLYYTTLIRVDFA